MNRLGQITMRRPARAATAALLAAFLLGTGAPGLAQSAPNADAEARLRKLEAEVRALQRQVFPGGDGKYFAPQVTAPATPSAAPGAPASTPVSDLLTRMDSVEAQIARLTAQSEETANRVAQIEAKMAAAAAVAAPPVGPADPAAAPAAPATSSAAPAAVPAASAAAVAAAPAALAPAPAKPAPAGAKPAATKPGVAVKPSAQRVAAVQKIEKPATGNAADDEYSYGFRLWEAKFYPEAQQQLRLYVDKYPKDAKISYGRNLLGRAFLDDGKPREAAPWFLQNYQNDKRGARAPDSLVMLAEAMRQLGDSSRGCIALAEFADNYAAEAAGRLKAQYEATRSALKCQ